LGQQVQKGGGIVLETAQRGGACGGAKKTKGKRGEGGKKEGLGYGKEESAIVTNN